MSRDELPGCRVRGADGACWTIDWSMHYLWRPIETRKRRWAIIITTTMIIVGTTRKLLETCDCVRCTPTIT